MESKADRQTVVPPSLIFFLKRNRDERKGHRGALSRVHLYRHARLCLHGLEWKKEEEGACSGRVAGSGRFLPIRSAFLLFPCLFACVHMCCENTGDTHAALSRENNAEPPEERTKGKRILKPGCKYADFLSPSLSRRHPLSRTCVQ
jgi:hypothetical protein